jgi:DNA ligase-1
MKLIEFKPMLAGQADTEKLRYPLMVSPKLDGIRALVINGTVVGRSLKPIPSKFIQTMFGRPELDGLDGELIVGEPRAEDVFTKTSSGVMSKEGRSAATFWVFDDFTDLGLDFETRHNRAYARVRKQKLVNRVKLVHHRRVRDPEELSKAEQEYLLQGYEGLMIRSLDGPYKCGRSTTKEGHLLKLKRFKDADAMIIGGTELMHNANEAERNELGQLERSTKKAGMVGLEALGSLEVVDWTTGVIFNIGTGFDPDLRKQLWKCREVDLQNGFGGISNIIQFSKKYPGKFFGRIVKYKYQPHGVKDKPRFPVFMGFRHPEDM